MASLLLIAAPGDDTRATRDRLVVAGHDVVQLSSIDDAIANMREGGIDLLLLNTHDSLGNLSQLVASLNRLVDAPPLLLMSDSPRAPEISARIGAAGFLPTPCEPDDVLFEVARLLGPLRQATFIEEEPTDLHRVRTLAEG